MAKKKRLVAQPLLDAYFAKAWLAVIMATL